MKTLILAVITLTLNLTMANPNIKTVEGKFYYELDAIHAETGNHEHLYQFRSDDDSVWWLLTEEEIGHAPTFDAKYSLTYDDKGTTAENKTCDCLPEWECECEVYDDQFIVIKEVN